MTSINDDDLILYLLDELNEAERTRIAKAIATDEALQQQYHELASTMDASKAWHYEADTGLEQRIWNQVEVTLNQPPHSPQAIAKSDSVMSTVFNWFKQPAFVFTAITLAVVTAFMSGRLVEHQEMLDNPEQIIASLDDQARQNILVQSVVLHFERTSRLMTTVSVSDQPNLADDEKLWADRLLTSNRIFKVAAKQAQQWRIVSLLEELEPLLIEMANADNNQLTSRNRLKNRIDQNGLVFKTRNFSNSPKPAI